MNVLNERFDPAFRFRDRQTSSPLAVARKRRSNDSHQRSVARKKYSRRSIGTAEKLRVVSDRQARQRIPGSGNTGDEANDFPVVLLCPGNGFHEFRGRAREIENIGVGR